MEDRIGQFSLRVEDGINSEEGVAAEGITAKALCHQWKEPG